MLPVTEPLRCLLLITKEACRGVEPCGPTRRVRRCTTAARTAAGNVGSLAGSANCTVLVSGKTHFIARVMSKKEGLRRCRSVTTERELRFEYANAAAFAEWRGPTEMAPA